MQLTQLQRTANQREVGQSSWVASASLDTSPTQFNTTQLDVELSCVAINGPLVISPGQMSVRPCGVNIFKTWRLWDRWVHVDKLGMCILWVWLTNFNEAEFCEFCGDSPNWSRSGQMTHPERIHDGSLPKCTGFILLSSRVISPSIVKSADDCMKNANKSPKIPHSTMMKEKKTGPESVSGTGSPPTVNQL